MNAKEKAQYLINKFDSYSDGISTFNSIQGYKLECAKALSSMLVNEILEYVFPHLTLESDFNNHIEFWEEVSKEIENYDGFK